MTKKYTRAPTRTARKGSGRSWSQPTKTTRGGGTALGHVAPRKSSEKCTDDFNRHHRWPKGNKNRPKDVITVKKSQHRGFHMLFPNDTWHDPEAMEEILNTFIRPDYRVIIIKR